MLTHGLALTRQLWSYLHAHQCTHSSFQCVHTNSAISQVAIKAMNSSIAGNVSIRMTMTGACDWRKARGLVCL